MKSTFWAVVLSAIALLPCQLGAQTAGATSICVLEPESGLLSADKLARLGEGLRQAVARHPGINVVQGPALTVRLLRLRARCTGAKAACLASMGRVARADRLLYTRLGGAAGAFLVEMQLVDVKRRGVLDTYTSAEPVGEEALLQALEKGWAYIYGPARHSQIKVSSNVIGAEVLLDGEPIGRTPLVITKDIEAGEHQIDLRSPGYRERRESIRVEGREGVTLHLVMEKEEQATPVVAAKLAGAKEEMPATEPVKPVPGLTAVRRPPLAKEHPSEMISGAATAAPGKEPFLPEAGAAAEPAEKETARPLYRKWWFWTAVGLAVAASATTGLVLGLSGGESIPAGKGRVTIDF